MSILTSTKSTHTKKNLNYFQNQTLLNHNFGLNHYQRRMQRHEQSNEIRRAVQQQEPVDRRRAELMSLLIEGGIGTNSTTADTGLAQRHLQRTLATATNSTAADFRLEQSLQLMNEGRLNLRNVGDIHDQLASTASAGTGTDLSLIPSMRPTNHEYSSAYSFLASRQPDRQRLTLATALNVLQNDRQTAGSLFLQLRQAQQQQNTSNSSVAQRLLVELELRERALLQLTQLEQLQATQRHLLVAQQQNNPAGTASAALARTLLLSGDSHPSTTMLRQQSPLRARVPSLGNEFHDFNLRRTSALSFLENRRDSINNLNSTVAGSLTDDQLLRHYQDLRLYPSSLFQYRDATTPPNAFLSDQSGRMRATQGAQHQANDPIILESGLSGYMQRKKLNLLVDDGKSDENLSQKKRMKLAHHDCISQTERTKLFLKTPTPSTTAMFPLPQIKEKKDLKLDLSSLTLSTFRKVWQNAGERSKTNPTLQKELFQRKITEQRLYYTGTSVSVNKGLKKSASPSSD